MKCLSKYWIYCAILLTTCIHSAIAELGNPYEILGIHRKATLPEIRKAYKQLAREWHPDKKQKDPAAEEHFVKVSQAYNLLSDVDRRKLYDDKGITEQSHYPDHAAFRDNPFDDLFGQHGAYFNFQENDITFFHKLSISTRQYDKLIVPKSEKTPHLIFFYTDWCFDCLQLATYCRKLVDKLEPLGVNFVTVHSKREPNLARRLNIHTLPCLVLLLDGNVHVYKETITSVQRIIEFLRKKLPYRLVPRVETATVGAFLAGWSDNRVRGLIFEPRQSMRLRYLLTAYHFRDRVAFAFVDSPEIRAQYQIAADLDTLLLFNENATMPVASLAMRDIPTSTLHHVVASNQFLALPRLSSQAVLDALCPCEWNRPRKRLCVVLVTMEGVRHDAHRQAFRVYAQNAPYGADRVRFAYIYREKQVEFVNSLMPDEDGFGALLRVVVFWRRDESHVKYEWIDEKWESEESFNLTTQKMEVTIGRLLRTNEALSFEASVKDLFDEHAKGVFGKMAMKIGAFVGSIYDDLGKEQILPALSIIGTLLFILAVGYFLAYLVRLEEENVQKQKAKANSGNNNNDSSNYQPELRLHELRAEKYNGLVRLLKPGCRIILLVLDMQSRQQLIPPFHKAVWPYRKNKTLMFSYMYIERGLNWYKELLQLSLPEESELNINPRNCVGTVLALNGHRKYFCMFHAKHTEKYKKKMQNKLNGVKHAKSEQRDCESGTFIGFDTDSSESDDEILLQENLLDGLPNWLDRLFEGTTQRYHINYWPDFLNK